MWPAIIEMLERVTAINKMRMSWNQFRKTVYKMPMTAIPCEHVIPAPAPAVSPALQFSWRQSVELQAEQWIFVSMTHSTVAFLRHFSVASLNDWLFESCHCICKCYNTLPIIALHIGLFVHIYSFLRCLL